MVKKDHRSQGPVWKILTGPFIFKITKLKVMIEVGYIEYWDFENGNFDTKLTLKI